jgi:hypothetical protein
MGQTQFFHHSLVGVDQKYKENEYDYDVYQNKFDFLILLMLNL